jgi:hypothetical protein
MFSCRKTKIWIFTTNEGACGDREIKMSEEEFDSRHCIVKTEIKLEVLQVDWFE